MARKPNPDTKNIKEIIGICLETIEGISWPLEMKTAKLLYAKYKDIEHWREFPETLDFKPDSLVFFFCPYGKKLLEEHFSDEGYAAVEQKKRVEKLEIEPPKRYDLQEKALVDFHQGESKPKTFREFLKNYGKN